MKPVESSRNIVFQINVNEKTVQDGTGMTTGYNVAEININHGDGRVSRFFVDARINSQDRAKVEVATVTPSGRTISKSVTGYKRNMS